MTSSDLSVEYLIDRQKIRDLMTEYCMRLDEYDPDGLVMCFTADGVMNQGPGRGGPVTGRAPIAKGVRERQAIFKRTCHHLGQNTVKIDGDTAGSVTYVTAWHEEWDGTVRVAHLRYVDVLRKVDGDWKIAERSSRAMGVTGFEDAMWNWVERRTVQK